MELISFLSSISWPAILCFSFGFLLVIVEMFHPGLGAPGIFGTILLVAAILLSARSIIEMLIILTIIIAVLGVALTLVLQSATKGRLSKILILNETQKKEAGYIGTDDLQYFIGQEGVTVSILRPAGTADFNGIKMDVVSEGDFILKDAKVKIIQVEGRRIVVREI